MRYVYLDVITVINVAMNLVILLLTSWLAQVPARFYRVALGAMLGTAYTVYLVFYPLSNFAYWPAKVVVSVLILVATFAPVSPVRFLRATGYFYLVSFTLGGAALAIYYLGQDFVLPTIAGPWPRISWWMPLAGSVVVIPIARLAWLYLKRRRWQEELTATLIVRWNGQERKISGILDSGNLLVDPLTGAPVVVVEAEALSGLVPETIIGLVEGGRRGELDLEQLGQALAADCNAQRFRVIPFDSLGQENSLLLGFRPDRVQVKYQRKNINVPRAVVGLAPGRLSSEGTWQALVSPEVLMPYLDEA
ncbi:MAG: sigma-E processing peptidase SpoIIGA [bacterium]|jgi:stage II sporulation protein GA (sporulation sigma-E factor processing peptidase)